MADEKEAQCPHVRTSAECASYCDLAETAVKTLEARLARAHNAMRVAEDQALTVAAELDEATARAESAETRIAELEAQLGAEKERAWAFEQMASETSLDKIKKWFYEIHRTNENFSKAVISCQFRAAEAEAEAARLRAVINRIAAQVGHPAIAQGEVGIESVAEYVARRLAHAREQEERLDSITPESLEAFAASSAHHDEHHEREAKLRAALEIYARQENWTPYKTQYERIWLGHCYEHGWKIAREVLTELYGQAALTPRQPDATEGE